MMATEPENWQARLMAAISKLDEAIESGERAPAERAIEIANQLRVVRPSNRSEQMDERTKTIDSIVRNQGAGSQWIWAAVAAAYDAGVTAERERLAQWVRDNYQDHANIAGLCDAMLAVRA
jgi:hypothetical protein